MFVFQSCCRAVRSADHFNNVESVVAEECTVAPTLDSSMMRSKSEIRILQKPIPQNYHGIVAKARPRSLFEASAIRVAKHSSNKRHMTGQPDTDNQGIPARFMDAYLAALRDSNVRYVNARNVSVTNRCQPKMVKVHTCMLYLFLRCVDDGSKINASLFFFFETRLQMGERIRNCRIIYRTCSSHWTG
jgi:hypothetical protein